MRAYLRPAYKKTKCPAVFLDRDGTIIHNRPGAYLTDPRDMKIYKTAAAALKVLQKLGYRLIVLTNQSAVGRGYMTMARSKAINLKLVRDLAALGVYLDGIYFCPHRPDDACACRKPATGLLKEALRDRPLDMGRSLVIGDKFSDIQLADAFHIRSIFLRTGEGARQLKKYGAALKRRTVVKDLMAAARAERAFRKRSQ